MWGRGADVVHGTNYVVPPARASALVVTVHDLSALRFPEWCRPAARAYPDLVKKAVDRGAWVHADSTFVAREVTELLGVPATRVRAVHLGVSPPSAAGPAARALPDWVTSYILAVGTVEPRKGFPLLVDAFGRLAGGHPGLALVIAGSSGWGSADLDRAVAACPAGERVLRLGWVDDQQRDALTAAATVFAYPSRYEGFGLPPLQAMAAGTPVVASDCGALAEVLGDAALLVPAGDADSLAGALGRLLDDAGARSQLSQRGIGRAATFTWELCATGMVALYREAAAAHR
jgi:glycosyltransferase involved in cell wall biosynthesis